MPIVGDTDLTVKISSTFDDKGVDQASSGIDSLGNATQRADTKTGGMTTAFFKAGIALEAVRIGADLVGSAIQKFIDLGADVLASASAYEQSAIAFKVMIGDAGRAQKLLKDISVFAAKTPFDLPDLVEGSKRLLAYNVSAEKILPTISMLGDISAGVGREKLPFLITALGQVQAKTKLSGEELRQFTETGVPLIQELAKVTGHSVAAIASGSGFLNITYAQVEQALRNMTSEGGKFYGLMAEQANTYDGTITNLRDNFLGMGREIIGISTDGTIREGSLFDHLRDSAQDLLGWVDQNRVAIEQFGRGLLDNVVMIIRDYVLPFIREFGKKLMEYISSPQFKADMELLWKRLVLVGEALVSAAQFAGWVIDKFDLMGKMANIVWKAMQNISSVKFTGMVAQMLTGDLPGVKEIKSLGKTLKIPGFATGTSFAPGGLALVGERGPELVNLPRGSQVTPASTTARMADRTPIEQHNTFNVFNQLDLDLAIEKAGYSLFARR